MKRRALRFSYWLNRFPLKEKKKREKRQKNSLNLGDKHLAMHSSGNPFTYAGILLYPTTRPTSGFLARQMRFQSILSLALSLTPFSL